MIAGPLPMRDGAITVAALIDLYMARYTGRDVSRSQRLRWWTQQLGTLTLESINDDHIHVALETLAARPPRYFAGLDADGKAIHKIKDKARLVAPGTVNRYSAALAAVFTWAVRQRITPKGWDHPCRRVQRKTENNERVRFLDDGERTRLLSACQQSKWPRLYLLVLAAITTGARRGELMALRWRDIDTDRKVAHVGHSKNGDPKLLPLVPAVVEQLVQFAGKPDALVFGSARDAEKAFSVEPHWQAALKAAGIENCKFHDLRHSCASYLAQNGATLLEIGDLLGHRTASMTRRYSHLASSHRAALVNRVLGDLR